MKQVDLEQQAKLVFQDEPFRVIAGVSVIGTIPLGTDFEIGDAHLLVKRGETLGPDLVVDDRTMVLEVREGVVVVLGCCHAGLINTLRYVRRHFDRPIIVVLGGSHLKPASRSLLNR